jgi:hypothetical protein
MKKPAKITWEQFDTGMNKLALASGKPAPTEKARLEVYFQRVQRLTVEQWKRTVENVINNEMCGYGWYQIPQIVRQIPESYLTHEKGAKSECDQEGAKHVTEQPEEEVSANLEMIRGITSGVSNGMKFPEPENRGELTRREKEAKG